MTPRFTGPAPRTRLDLPRGASTRAHVYAILRRAIVTLEFLPGQALSENELAAKYEVSRTPIREALIRLGDDGLVDVVPQLGTFVSRISATDVIEVRFIRETLERASLPHAIERIGPTGARTLHRILAEQDEAEADGDLRRWFATDEELHRTLLEIGGHPKIWPIVSSAKAHLDRVRMLSLPDPGMLRELHGQHRAIVDHVVAQDLPAADEELRRHLQVALGVLRSLEERHPDYFILDDPD